MNASRQHTGPARGSWASTPAGSPHRDDEFDHVVVWDGTRKSASGTAYLAAKEEATRVTPARAVAIVPMHDRIEDYLSIHGPQTARAIAQGLHRQTVQVTTGLSTLRERGKVVVVARRPIVAERSFGRRYEHVYGLTGSEA